MKKEASYQELSAELNALLLELQQENLDVDVAIRHYERGLVLVKELEKYLSEAENKVSKLKAKFSDA
jgi:exodeoxyribonuclease VII small subunit